TRALAEATGLSQSIVSRSLRSLTVAAAEVTGGRELVLAAAGFPLLVFGVRADGSAGEGVGGPAGAPRRIRRRIAGITAALRSGEIGDEFLVFDPLGEVPDSGPGAGPDSGPDAGPAVSVHRDFEEFVVALKHVLAGCQDIPGSLLDQFAARVRNGLEGVMW